MQSDTISLVIQDVTFHISKGRVKFGIVICRHFDACPVTNAGERALNSLPRNAHTEGSDGERLSIQ